MSFWSKIGKSITIWKDAYIKLKQQRNSYFNTTKENLKNNLNDEEIRGDCPYINYFDKEELTTWRNKEYQRYLESKKRR